MNSNSLLRVAFGWSMILACAAPAPAADWRPGKPVEIIVGTPPGGPLDETAQLSSANTARFMQEEHKHLEALLTELGDAKK